MPQIYDMGPTALLPSEGRHAEDFFALKIRRLPPGLNLQTWVLKASTLPLDHRSHRSYLLRKKSPDVDISPSRARTIYIEGP